MYRIVFLLVLVPFFAVAHIPQMVAPESPRTLLQIDDPTISKAYYGNLVGFPHTYQLVSNEPFLLDIEILVPDIERAENIVSGIVVQQLDRGGVTEVVRLPASDASWESFNEPYGNDDYRQGGSFETELEAGSYLIEMSTPRNIGPYIFVIGELEDFSELGYFETVRRIAEVKAFFGKSKFAVVESPVVYGPIIIVLLIVVGFLGYRRFRKKQA